MAKRSSLRASDADRDRVAERLRQAASEGRLLAHEFEERLHRTLRASTYGELDDVVADLPGTPRGMERKRPSHLELAGRHPFMAVGVLVLSAIVLTAVLAVALVVAMLSSIAFLLLRTRGGQWGRRGQMTGFGTWGRFGAPQIRAYARRSGRF